MGTKNKISDLNNHLYEQLERLNDDSLSEHQLEQEVQRANAMSQLGTVIVNNNKVALSAMKLAMDGGEMQKEFTKFLGN